MAILRNIGTLAQLEREARAAKRGLWADPNPIPPWEWPKIHGAISLITAMVQRIRMTAHGDASECCPWQSGRVT